MRKKKEKILLNDVEITDFAAEGNAIAKNDDKVIFIPNVVPGDIVDLEIYKQKKSYSLARLVKINHYSDKRVEEKCPHFQNCGGCSWQMLDYKWQLKYKQQQVVDALERIGKVDCKDILPILASDNIYYYRNKLEFTFSNKAWVENYDKEMETTPALGFHVSGFFDKVLDIKECVLQKEPSNEIRNFIREYALENEISFYDIKQHTGLLRNLVIRTTEKGSIMVIVVFSNDEEKEVIEKMMSSIKEKFPQITSLMYCINKKMNDSLSDQEFILFSGEDFIMEYMPRYSEKLKENNEKSNNPLQFKIRPKTFYQTNAPQALKLYTVAASFAEITKDDVVYDLYTGTGTIANFVANQAKKVVGIEYVEDAIEDAKINSKENGIDNTSFFAGDMVDVLNDEFIEKNSKPDIIITDPPRNGMATKVIDEILKIESKRVVYISCNPATQARDILLLSSKYEVKKIQPVDMFPHTHHIENVVLLEKKQ
jgi:23S rRNA (uracil1939-C5)-methyltransferase